MCLIIDVWLPGLDGLELQSLLADHDEQFVFLTGHGNVTMCAKAMKAGAVDFLTKPVDDEVLLAAVTRALGRSHDIAHRRTEREAARAMLDVLTPRELQVMQCVVAGLMNKQIAAKLGIAEKTVKIHRGRVMKKTRCISVPDLMRLILKADDTGKPEVNSPQTRHGQW